MKVSRDQEIRFFDKDELEVVEVGGSSTLVCLKNYKIKSSNVNSITKN